MINILPDVVHWYGASYDSELTHIAINPDTQKGAVEWFERETDDEYNSFK